MKRIISCLAALILCLMNCPAMARTDAPELQNVLSDPSGVTVSAVLSGIDTNDEHVAELLSSFFEGLEMSVTALPGRETGEIRWGDVRTAVSGAAAMENADDVSRLIFRAADLIAEICALSDVWHERLNERTEITRNYADRTMVKNVGSAASADQYTFRREDMPEVHTEFTDLKDEYPLAASLTALLCRWTGFDWDDAVFTGQCAHKRLFDKDGEPMGIRTEGRVAFDDEAEYRFTCLMGAAAEKGGYFSLEMNRTRGTGQHRYILGWKITEKNESVVTDITGSWLSKTNDFSFSGSVEGKLTVKTADDEHVTGSITVNTNRDGLKSVRNVNLDLTTADGRSAGTAGISVTMAGEKRWSLDADLTIAPGGNAVETTDPDQAAGLLIKEAMKRISVLSEEDRTLLTHTLFSARWMDMSPEPDDTADYDEWSVKEE